MRRRWTVVACLWMAVVCLALPASAEEAKAARATDRGQWLIGGGLGAFWSNDDTGVPWPHLVEWSAHANPSATYFFRDRIGVGPTVGGWFGRERFGRSGYELHLREHQVSVGIQSVLELPLGAKVGLVALTEVSYVRAWRNWKLTDRTNVQGRGLQQQTVLANEASDFDAHLLRATLFLPLSFHASQAVVLGFGPALWYDHVLSREPERDWTSFGRELGGFYLGASSWIGVAF